ncbi:hypothetical protein [Capnocytophaga sputigena]|jgi:hypothetical protein
MARDILYPTPTLTGKDADAFWEKVATFGEHLKKLGITREKIEADANYLKSIFKES